MKYKEALDNQYKTREYMNMYGNMTGIEKQLNKNDLIAFKHYDNKTYALIPGLNSVSYSPSKKIAEEKEAKKGERTHEEELQRMNQFGLTRDVTLVKNPATLSTQNAHRSSVDDITGHNNTARNKDLKSLNRTSVTANTATPNLPFTTSNVSLNTFNNHHLYQSYNPISGVYSPEKQAMNQARSTFRFAANSIIK